MPTIIVIYYFNPVSQEFTVLVQLRWQNDMATTCQNYKDKGDGNNVISGNSSRYQPFWPSQPTNTPSNFKGVKE